jgi:hypothetical protein
MKLRILLAFQSGPRDYLQLPANPRRSLQTHAFSLCFEGVFPLFPERDQGRSDIFRILEIQACSTPDACMGGTDRRQPPPLLFRPVPLIRQRKAPGSRCKGPQPLPPQSTETVPRRRACSLRASWNASSAGMKRGFLTGRPRRP